MEELDVDGLFWLASQPDDQIAGRLKFDAVNRAELSLIGSFHGPESSRAHDELFSCRDPVRILGIAGKRLLTLERCSRAGIRIELPGMITERYFPEVILSGALFDEAEMLEFSGIRFELSHLDEWVSRSSTSVRFITDSAGNKTGEIQINHKPREKTSVSIDVGELELGYRYDYRLDSITETAIRQRCFIGVRFNEPRCLENVLEEGASLQNLVTIGVHSPSSFNSVSLSHLARTRTLPNGKEFSEPIKMYAQFRGSNVSGREKPILPMPMFFTFDDIGGLDGMARWLTTSTKFRHAIDSLLSHWYLPKIYTDNRLLNMIVAAEAVERIRRQRQGIDFKRALIDLANIAGEPFGEMVQNVDEWAKVIVRIRKENLE